MRNPLPTTGPWLPAGILCYHLVFLAFLTAVPAAGASPLADRPGGAGVPAPGPAQAPEETPSVASPSFFGVSVGDLEAAESWYRRVLGLETVRSVQSRNGDSRAVVMRRGELVVELVHFDGSRTPRADLSVEHPFQIEGLIKAGMFVADAELWHQYLVAAGVEADAQVITDEALGMRTFVFRDPDGNRIQVFERCEQGC